jgi:hypothetical protein
MQNMKFNLKGALALLMGVTFFYTGCKNNNTPAPASPVVSADLVSNQIALNIAQSLSGSYGGVNLNDGISSPAIATSGASHRAVNSMNSLCGFFVDSTLNYNTNIGDTIKSHTGGSLKFYFDCVLGHPDGYTAYDSLRTTGTAPGYSFLYDVTQYYEIKSLNSKNTLLFVNGNLKSFVDLVYDKKGIKPTSAHVFYVLTGLHIDLADKSDITSGIATFTSTGSNNYGTWSYIGVVKFLGNHKADIIINGKTYHVTI